MNVRWKIGSLLLATVTFTPVVRAEVKVIDANAGDNWLTLAGALNNADDGDILVLKPGDYTPPDRKTLFVSGVTVTLIGVGTPRPTLGPIEVRDVPPAGLVVIRGLQLGESEVPDWLGFSMPGLTTSKSAGSIWIEDCVIEGMNGTGALPDRFFPPFNHHGSPAVHVSNCDSVTLQRCTLSGGRGAPYAQQPGFELFATYGGEGLAVGNSSVVATDCVMLGGAGGNGQTIDGSQGASGANGAFAQTFCTLYLTDCSLTGGSNGVSNTSVTDGAGNGLTLQMSTAFQRGCSFTPGQLLEEGVAAVPIWPLTGGVIDHTAAARSLVVSSPMQEGDPGTVVVGGLPGDQATLLVAIHGGWTLLQSKQGVLVLNPLPTLLVMPLGTIGAGGTLSLGFTTPNLPASLEGVTMPMQLLVQSGDGLTLEGASALVWLDASL